MKLVMLETTDLVARLQPRTLVISPSYLTGLMTSFEGFS